MIGALRDRLTLLTPTRIADAGGGYQITYAEKDTVPARRIDSSSRNRAFVDRKLPVRRKQFTFRHRDDLVFEMRLRYEDRTYRITDIQVDEQRRYQTVTAEEMRS